MDEHLDPRLVIFGDEEPNITFLIPHGEVVVGRGSGAGIPLRYEGVSRRHALLTRTAGRVEIDDLQSLNGTWINGRKIDAPRVLHNNDLLQLGTVRIRFYEEASITQAAPIGYQPDALSTLNPAPTSAGYGSGRVTHENNRKQPEQDTTAPWYRRTKTLLIGAGAIAAAIGSIFALVDRLVDPEDVATIKSVTLTKRTPLADFPTDGLGKNLMPGRAPNASGQIFHDPSSSFSLIQVGPSVKTLLPPVSTQATSPSTSVPTKSEAAPGTSPTAPKPKPTGSSSPAATVSGSSPPQLSPKPSVTPVHRLPTESYNKAVQGEFVRGDVPPELADIPPDVIPSTVTIANSIIFDANNQLLSPSQVADALKQALQQIEIETSSDGDAQPMGWTLGVGFELEGLAHTPLLLTWSLDGVDLSGTWRAENLAYRIVASTQHDAGVAAIWVPDLKRAGVYNVNVRLVYESQGSVAAEGQLALPNQ